MTETQQQANRSILANHFPNLYQTLQQTQSTKSTQEFTIQACKKNGYTMLANSQSGKRFLHNQYDAIAEAQRWATENPPSEGAIALIMGWGLGYFALEWLHQHTNHCNAVILWEPDPQFFKASLPYIDLNPLKSHKNLQIILGCQAGAIYQHLHHYLSYLLNHELKIIAAPFVGIYGSHPIQLLKQEVSHIVSVKENSLNFMATMGERCQHHLIQNLKHLPHCWLPHDLDGIAKNQPGIIIAAGPSLDQNIHQLKNHTDHAWLFAVDTSLQTLLHHGIQPDVVVSKDPTDLNTEHFKFLSHNHSHDPSLPILAFDPIIPTEICELFPNPKIWLPGRNKQIYKFLDNHHLQSIDQLPYSTNVSIAAFHLANVMGCDPIIFVGLDLCFSKANGNSHAQQTALCAEVSFDQSTQQLTYTRGNHQDVVHSLMVEGIDGKQYPTIEPFYETLRLFEQLIQQTSVQCIDASEGGAKIAGTEILPLKLVLEQYCQTNLNKTFPEVPIHNTTTYRENLNTIATYLEDCQRIAQEALVQLKDTDCYDCINLAGFDIKRGWLEENNKLYSLLEPALERLLVEIDRPGFFAGLQEKNDQSVDDYNQEQHQDAELIRRYAWYFYEIEKTCHTFIPHFKKIADSI